MKKKKKEVVKKRLKRTEKKVIVPHADLPQWYIDYFIKRKPKLISSAGDNN